MQSDSDIPSPKSTKNYYRTHGLSKTKIYAVWEGIKQRCLNPKSKFYKYYGGRGITLCLEWSKSFEAFYADMGPRSNPTDTIERIDNNGNYEPSNCRWASRAEQGKNRREPSNAVKITYQGKTKTMVEWARHLDVPYQILYHRWLRSPNEDFGLLCVRPPRTSGEHHPRARYTNEQVREMRRLYFDGECNYAEVGRRFGLDRRHARAIVIGQCYKNVI